MTQTHDKNRDLSWKLYKLTFLMGRLAEQTLADQADLTFGQFKLLMALRRHGQISQKTVAKFHGLTEAAVSRKIQELVKQKLITRVANPINRREHLLSLTPKGEKQATKAHDTLSRKFESLFSVLGSNRTQFQLMLDALLGAIWEKNHRIFCGPSSEKTQHHVT
jgi:DNA-binding MarR family transcriptional regulator